MRIICERASEVSAAMSPVASSLVGRFPYLFVGKNQQSTTYVEEPQCMVIISIATLHFFPSTISEGIFQESTGVW